MGRNPKFNSLQDLDNSINELTEKKARAKLRRLTKAVAMGEDDRSIELGVFSKMGSREKELAKEIANLKSIRRALEKKINALSSNKKNT